MRYAWRWFGTNDPVKISDGMQVGTKEIVTALHHVPNGTVWSIEEIKKKQHEVSNGTLEQQSYRSKADNR